MEELFDENELYVNGVKIEDSDITWTFSNII